MVAADACFHEVFHEDNYEDINIEGKDIELEEVLKSGTSFYKIKSRNVTAQGIDMIVELKTKDENALMEKVLAIPAVERATLMAHDGEVTY